MKELIVVAIPVAAAISGFVMGGLIGYAADRRRRMSLARRARSADQCTRALADSCREVLSDAWFNKVRRRYLAKVEID